MMGVHRKRVVAMLNATLRMLLPAGRWTQRRYSGLRDDGVPGVCYCLRGALMHLRDEGQATYMTFLEAERQLVKTLDGVCIVDWNDEPGRTQREVRAVLRQTIRRLGGEAAA